MGEGSRSARAAVALEDTVEDDDGKIELMNEADDVVEGVATAVVVMTVTDDTVTTWGIEA